MGKKHDQIRDHFYSSPLNVKTFSETYFQTYGYVSAERFQKVMRVHNILIRERIKWQLANLPTSKIESTDFDELDNFGFENSIGEEHLPTSLPDHFKMIGILSDIHVPFHSMDALICAIKELKRRNIDCLYLNGDTFDQYSISRHERDPNLRDFPKEVEMCRNFMQTLRSNFPLIPIYFKAGNHENRYQRYLNDQAEEFAQLHEMQFNQFFRLDHLDIKFIPDWQGVFMGDLLVIHGHEGFGVGGINPSQSLFNKMFCNTLMGHVHRQTTTTRKTGFGQYIHTYSTGCLTTTAPKYMPFNQHTQGFAVVEITDGKSKVDLIAIKDGKIV